MRDGVTTSGARVPSPTRQASQQPTSAGSGLYVLRCAPLMRSHGPACAGLLSHCVRPAGATAPPGPATTASVSPSAGLRGARRLARRSNRG